MTDKRRANILDRVNAAGAEGISWTQLAGTASREVRESFRQAVDELVRDREIVRQEVRQAKGPRAVRLYPADAIPADWTPKPTRRLVVELPEPLRAELGKRAKSNRESLTDLVVRALEAELSRDLL